MRDSCAIYRPADRDPKPILFIDGIHLLLGAGSASGSMDAANIHKHAPARGAIRVRRHLRPELVNRLTKVVHFKPLEMDTAREILGKLVVELNARLENLSVPRKKEDSGGETPPTRSPP